MGGSGDVYPWSAGPALDRRRLDRSGSLGINLRDQLDRSVRRDRCRARVFASPVGEQRRRAGTRRHRASDERPDMAGVGHGEPIADGGVFTGWTGNGTRKPHFKAGPLGPTCEAHCKDQPNQKRHSEETRERPIDDVVLGGPHDLTLAMRLCRAQPPKERDSSDFIGRKPSRAPLARFARKAPLRRAYARWAILTNGA